MRSHRFHVLSALVAVVSLGAFVSAQDRAQVAPAAETSGYRAAADYSKANDGLAVLIFEDEKLVFEEYQNGHRQDKAHHIYSGTKSFAPIVALLAQEEGLLDLEESVADTITEWRGDESREQIRIRHLLDFTSGLEINDRKMHAMRTRDKYACAIECKSQSPAGKRFRYGSSHLMVFGEVLNRKLRAAEHDAKDFVDYLRRRVLDPIGCKVGYWIRDGKKNPALPYGAFLTARNWAKFGQLILRGGRHGEGRIIPKKLLEQCFVGTKANPIYGLNFWLIGKRLHRYEDRIPVDTVSAAGMYNQKLYVVPSKNLVIVRFGKTGIRSKFQDAGFLGRLFSTEASQDSSEASLETKRGDAQRAQKR